MPQKILIIGGNRFFGRHLASELVRDGHFVTLLNRGNHDDGFGSSVQRLKADRSDRSMMERALKNHEFDLVYDQTCYSATDAELVSELFKNRTNRLIVTSTESVYDVGNQYPESAFDPRTYDFKSVMDFRENYQEAKRQVEVVYTRQSNFEIAIARPSLVVGTDDYTNRLNWHIDRISKGLEIYFPSIDARSDFIRSDQAGTAMKLIGLSDLKEPVNCTTRGSISLIELIQMIEQVLNKKAILTDKMTDENHSPYGGKASKTMNTDLLYSLGFNAQPSPEWMPGLIKQLI